MRKLHLCIGLFLLGGILAHADDPKELRLKKRIGYEQRRAALAHMENRILYVRSLPNIRHFHALDLGWSSGSFSMGASFDCKFVSKTQKCEKGYDKIYVSWWNFGEDVETAIKMLFRVACENPTADSPFSAGPTDVGNISLIQDGRISKRLFFVYHGVLVMVRLEAVNSDFDIIDFGRWIHSQMKFEPAAQISHQNPVPASIDILTLTAMPRHRHLVNVAPGGMREISLSHQSKDVVRARVGEPVVIRVNPPVGADISRYELDYDWGEHFRLAGMQGLGKFDRAMNPVRPGRGVYKYVLIDRETLLAYWGEVQFDIQP